jgi:hypothetical protein
VLLPPIPGLGFPIPGKTQPANHPICKQLPIGTPFAEDITSMIRYVCFYALW